MPSSTVPVPSAPPAPTTIASYSDFSDFDGPPTDLYDGSRMFLSTTDFAPPPKGVIVRRFGLLTSMLNDPLTDQLDGFRREIVGFFVRLQRTRVQSYATNLLFRDELKKGDQDRYILFEDGGSHRIVGKSTDLVEIVLQGLGFAVRDDGSIDQGRLFLGATMVQRYLEKVDAYYDWWRTIELPTVHTPLTLPEKLSCLFGLLIVVHRRNYAPLQSDWTRNVSVPSPSTIDHFHKRIVKASEMIIRGTGSTEDKMADASTYCGIPVLNVIRTGIRKVTYRLPLFWSTFQRGNSWRLSNFTTLPILATNRDCHWPIVHWMACHNQEAPSRLAGDENMRRSLRDAATFAVYYEVLAEQCKKKP